MLRLQQERRFAVQVLDRRSTGISETRDGIPTVLAHLSCEPGRWGRAVKRPPTESEGHGPCRHCQAALRCKFWSENPEVRHWLCCVSSIRARSQSSRAFFSQIASARGGPVAILDFVPL